MRTSGPEWIKDTEYQCPGCKHRLSVIKAKDTIDGKIDLYYNVFCPNHDCNFRSKKYYNIEDVEDFLKNWTLRKESNVNAQFGDYEKVLVRNNNNEPWTPNFYGYYDYSKNDHVCMNGKHYSDCILYDKHKELSGTIQEVEYRNTSHDKFEKYEEIEYVDLNSKTHKGKFFDEYDSVTAVIFDCDDNYLKIPYSNIRKIKPEDSKAKKNPEYVKDSTDWKAVAYLLAERLKNNSNDIYDKNSSVEDLINNYRDFLQYDKYSTYERLGFRSMADFFQNAIDKNNEDIKEANRVCQKYSKGFRVFHDDGRIYNFKDNSKLLIKTFNNVDYSFKVYQANEESPY